MHVPNHLKQLTQQTTQVAVSTGFLASALVGTGCVAAGRDDELGDINPVDAGDDAIVDELHLNTLETASHAYHAPPVGSDPVVIPLDLEDAPVTPPPVRHAAAPGARRAEAPRAARTGRAAQADAEDCDESLRDAVDAVSRATRRDAALAEVSPAEAREGAAEREAQRPAPARRARPVRRQRDPIADSFVPTTGRSMLPGTYSGGRSY